MPATVVIGKIAFEFPIHDPKDVSNMIIRLEQFDAFAEQGNRRFEDSLIEFLQQQFSDSAEIQETEFRTEVRNQIRIARSYGLETEQQLATYVVAAYALGTDFDTRFPAAEQVLQSSFYTAQQKTDWLDNWTRTLFEQLEEKG